MKHQGRRRDLLSSQPGVNGKGSADRTLNDEQYRKNWDEINWCSAGGTNNEQCNASGESGASCSDSQAERPAALFDCGAGADYTRPAARSAKESKDVSDSDSFPTNSRCCGGSCGCAAGGDSVSPVPPSQNGAPDFGCSPRKSTV